MLLARILASVPSAPLPVPVSVLPTETPSPKGEDPKPAKPKGKTVSPRPIPHGGLTPDKARALFSSLRKVVTSPTGFSPGVDLGSRPWGNPGKSEICALVAEGFIGFHRESRDLPPAPARSFSDHRRDHENALRAFFGVDCLDGADLGTVDSAARRTASSILTRGKYTDSRKNLVPIQDPSPAMRIFTMAAQDLCQRADIARAIALSLAIPMCEGSAKERANRIARIRSAVINGIAEDLTFSDDERSALDAAARQASEAEILTLCKELQDLSAQRADTLDAELSALAVQSLGRLTAQRLMAYRVSERDERARMMARELERSRIQEAREASKPCAATLGSIAARH